jgi:hypothetical protein
MNQPRPFRSPSPAARRGIVLVEVLAYISVLTLMLFLGYGALNQCIRHASDLRRNGDDIALLLRVGEHWRSDIRQATGEPRLETGADEELLRLPGAHGDVTYRFTAGQILRRDGDGAWICVLDRVRNSAMRSDRRSTVTAWRWELERETTPGRPVHMKPLFTFIAVPNRPPAP